MKLFDVIDQKTHVHLVMELCPGKSLITHIERFGEAHKLSSTTYIYYLREKEALRIFRQILSAVKYMHSLELIHRDLKANNILINSSTTEIKFTEFAFATCLHPSRGL